MEYEKDLFNNCNNAIIVAFWDGSGINSHELADGIKREGTINFLIYQKENKIEQMDLITSPYFEQISIERACEAIDCITKELSLSDNNVLFISNNYCFLEEFNKKYPHSNSLNEQYCKIYLAHKQTVKQIEHNVQKTETFNIEYYKNIQSGSSNKKKLKKILKKYQTKDQYARIELVKLYLSSKSIFSKLIGYTLCASHKSDGIPELKVILSKAILHYAPKRHNLNLAIRVLRNEPLESYCPGLIYYVELLKMRATTSDCATIEKICIKNGKTCPALYATYADCVFEGKLFEKNIKLAIEYYILAANSNIKSAKKSAINLLIDRNEGDDRQLAYQMCKKYTSEGDLWATVRLAEMYHKGIYVERDEEMSIDLMVQAYKFGAHWIKNKLIDMIYARGKNMEELISDLGLNDDPKVQYQYAKKIFNDGKIDDAINIMMQSAKTGFGPACNELSDYLLIRNRPEDYELAYTLIKEQSDKGNLWATARLSRMYHKGIYVKKDENTAIDLMRKASPAVPWIRNELIDILTNSESDEKQKEAYRLAQIGAYEGDPWCKIKLARMYLKNMNEGDIDLAIVLLRSAHNHGIEQATRELRAALLKRGNLADKKEAKTL